MFIFRLSRNDIGISCAKLSLMENELEAGQLLIPSQNNDYYTGTLSYVLTNALVPGDNNWLTP